MTDEHTNPILRGVQRQLDGCATFFFDAFTSLNVNGISGDYVEFGSWGGNTLNAAYRQLIGSGGGRHMWAFDSFQGLPPAADERDRHPGWQPGSPFGQGGVEKFHEGCDAHGIPRDAYTAVEGYYDDVLPGLGSDQGPTDIALAYIDCNMYSSTVTVLEFLAPRLKHGMIVAFDDWFCWSPTGVSGEKEALREFQEAHPQWNFDRYKDVHRSGVSFVVEGRHA
ncbi:MAG: hypothetical protein KDB02_09135 [Acidimicrobiales bacterium]|nr:hypothetical protein [Acidimicrobiales bacterium]